MAHHHHHHVDDDDKMEQGVDLPPPPLYAQEKRQDPIQHPAANPKDVLTLENLGHILSYLHRSEIGKLDETSLRAALSLTCAGIRKTNRSLINTMTELHMNHENLPQDQNGVIKQTYTGIHLDKGGQFEAALWQGWDKRSISLFVQAALYVMNNIPCESSISVQASYDHFILPQSQGKGQ
uniref:Fusion protein of Nucleoprotein and Minor nucleoprotein VP30 n=1 Tax=Lake Victoria marburgvirus (strain Musoke-80) TaxID=33727 RepID=UPI0008521CB1|nr:Chain A, Fusion protein of Nucleoprotein and Minor nucleoprotein VP30 [Marburg virus - Musoke, Kenya, 1980]5T3W_B Chain B, Fusion protein of Nucleoprotein and Minor nucleoprotein VP30 [Marburg virus - Musoke, Kenya, 1980]5T3W_C Chain C, Fusion protein of Nucleoprotein and Minor nucleoprotein VP30 [Marburg virus - Musoke, Kenya, 1980]5T3W_D Chain D, Fusion protein of Nucleoprotein and Minor nucleoprotein VP30 [Marburg virus - Musoke, Kenya, 1980]5T3W_E Chain E, Fusion protein of Nucleoprotein